MKQLTNTIQQLKLNTNFAISVEDNDTKVTIVRNFTGKMLTETYGSVEGFFEDLKSKGVEDVKIIDKKNNFPGWRTIDSYNMKIQTSNGTSAITAAPVQSNQAMAQNTNNNNMSGLLAGLNMMDVSHKVGDYPRVITENDRLRIENEALKEKIAELKETVMENKFSDNKSSANNELLKSIAPLLAPLAEKILGGGGAAVGLAAPQLPVASSPIKQSFFAMIANTDDEFVQDLMLAARGMSMEDPAFDNELTALVSKYQITL